MRRQHKTNNMGLSLIEVIVAVGIFGICAAILLRGFVTTGYVNRTSAKYQEATDLAQNIMEEIKGKTFPEVSLAFNYPVDKTSGSVRMTFLNDQADEIGGSLRLAEVLKKNGQYRSVRLYETSDNGDTSKVTASVISENGGISYEFNPRETGSNASKYYFTISGAKSGSNTYDALIQFDGSSSSSTKYRSGSVSSTDAGLNDYETPNIPVLDTTSSAMLTIGKNYLEQYLEGGATSPLNRQLSEAQRRWEADGSSGTEPTVLEAEDVYAYSKRTIHIIAEESGGSVKASVQYTLDTYDYQKSGGTKYETMSICPGNSETNKHDGKGDCFCHVETEEITFYSSETGADMKNLILFYYPNYNSTSEVSPLDNIIVENRTDQELNLYIAKQKDDAGEEENAGTSDVRAKEKTYKMSLKVVENPDAQGKNNWNTNPNLYRALTKLNTNLDSNIGDEDSLNRSTCNQMILTYQAVDSDGTEGKSVKNTLAKTILDCGGLDDREAEDRIYTVEVGVYKSGAADENFPEDMEILTLDGSKEG